MAAPGTIQCSLIRAVLALQVWLNDRGAGTSSALAIGLMLCFPFGFFWSSMYTESLFLALTLVTFIAFERGNWPLSSFCVFLAVLCRPTGLVMAPCLATLLLVQGSRLRSTTPSIPGTWSLELGTPTSWLPVLAGPLAHTCFAVYQWIAFGSPFASVQAEAVPPFARDFSQAVSDLMLRRPGFPPWYLAGLLGFALLFLAAVPLVYRRFGLPYALFAALVVLFPMTSGLTSMERYVLIDFPVFAALAMTRPRIIPVGLMIGGFYALLGFMAMFIAGYTLIDHPAKAGFPGSAPRRLPWPWHPQVFQDMNHRCATCRSKRSSHSFRLCCPVGGSRPYFRPAWTTRWQGTTIENGHEAMTLPTALAAPHRPALSPISP